MVVFYSGCPLQPMLQPPQRSVLSLRPSLQPEPARRHPTRSRSRRRSGRSSSGGRARPRACRTPVPPPPRRRSSRGWCSFFPATPIIACHWFDFLYQLTPRYLEDFVETRGTKLPLSSKFASAARPFSRSHTSTALAAAISVSKLAPRSTFLPLCLNRARHFLLPLPADAVELRRHLARIQRR